MDKNITQAMLDDWRESGRNLAYGDECPEVTILELLLQSFSSDLYTGTIDQKYGKGCRQGVTRFQGERLISEFGADGNRSVGPITRETMIQAAVQGWKVGDPFDYLDGWPRMIGVTHPSLGTIPGSSMYSAAKGRLSSFGGPDDSGDRIYGQAYIPGAKTPVALAGKHPELMEMGILRAEIAHLDEYPMVTDWRGREARADTSWCLDPESFYCAMRWGKSGGSNWSGCMNPRIAVWTKDKLRGCVVMRTDWGPHIRTGRIIDLSPGAIQALGVRTDDSVNVAWAANDAPLGPFTLKG